MWDFPGSVFGRRGERGLPRAAALLPPGLIARAARRRRKAGYYDRRTLALFRHAWRRSGSTTALLEYALFRHDLGHPLPPAWAEPLTAGFSRLSNRDQWLASALLKEAGLAPAVQTVERTSPADKKASEIQTHQDRWRLEFADLMRQRVNSGICVVGNAWKLRGSRLGDFIDSHAMVVRFNRFRNEASADADIGNRVGVWVVAPGFTDPQPPRVKWVVVSGPDMQYRLQSWKRLLPALSAGAAVLTVPLPPWRRLVARLQAPPSAGLLFLFWLRFMLGSWNGVTAVGFGLTALAARPYHHADRRQQPVRRHNWEEERVLLRQWKNEGLKFKGGPIRSVGRLIATSRAVARLPGSAEMLGAPVVHRWAVRNPKSCRAVIAWGHKPSARKAEVFAARHGLKLLRIEDGFLRSAGLNHQEPPRSVVVDDVGIYYDAAVPSRLEMLITQSLSPSQQERALRLVEQWRATRVSKYNHARDYTGKLPRPYVLVADQTRGDASVRHGQADAASFQRMLHAAASEHPDCTVLLKVHPEAMSGRKRGYFDLDAVSRLPRVEVLAEDGHPAGLIEQAEAVYAVSSQMGFEGLLWGKPVRTFGMPFYAGWGLTQDELPAPQRRAPVPLENLVYAALVAYPRYIDPETGKRCEVECLLEWMALQRRMQERFPAQVYALGFSPWKRPLVRAFLSGSTVRFAYRQSRVPQDATLVVWGLKKISRSAARPPAEKGKILRLEDGFLRSVGLGADLVRPLSWVVDGRGIYYDATCSSDLEHLLQTTIFDHSIRERARELMRRIVAHGMTKYNVGAVKWSRPDFLKAQPAPGSGGAGGDHAPPWRRVILVPGQVETDASIRFGAPQIVSNLELLRSVRAANPEAYLIYKPHPDVAAGLRRKGKGEDKAYHWCDELLIEVHMGDLLDAVDEVHVLTSLAGFEALLRGKRVVTYGQPFYAGWGLTEDRVPVLRRRRNLSLEELVAGVLILYPTYVSRTTRRFATPERALEELLAWREKCAGKLPWWRMALRWALRKA
jgi:capsular polysaccharide export protein